MWVQKLKSFSINFHSALFIDHTKNETWAKYSFAFLRFHIKIEIKKQKLLEEKNYIQNENDSMTAMMAKYQKITFLSAFYSTVSVANKMGRQCERPEHKLYFEIKCRKFCKDLD